MQHNKSKYRTKV